MAAQNNININNVKLMFEYLDKLLTEEDKAKIFKETFKYTHNEDNYSNDDRDSIYFSTLESILVTSRNSDKIKYQFETTKKATHYVVLGALCTAIFLTAAVLAIAGAVTLTVLFSPIWLISLIAVAPFIALGAIFTGIFSSNAFEKSNEIMQDPTYSEKIANLETKVTEGYTALNGFYSFFAAEETTQATYTTEVPTDTQAHSYSPEATFDNTQSNFYPAFTNFRNN